VLQKSPSTIVVVTLVHLIWFKIQTYLINEKRGQNILDIKSYAHKHIIILFKTTTKYTHACNDTIAQ